MTQLYTLTGKLAELQAMADTDDEGLKEALQHAMDEIQGEFSDKAESVVRILCGGKPTKPATRNTPSGSVHSWNWGSLVANAAESWRLATRPSSGSSPPTASTIPKRGVVALHAPHSQHPATQTSNLARTAGQRNRRGRPWPRLFRKDRRRLRRSACRSPRRNCGTR